MKKFQDTAFGPPGP